MSISLGKLTPETIAALGKNNQLVERYDILFKKSQTESLKDDLDAIHYVDDVIKRYKSIKATSPNTKELQEKKESYLMFLREHTALVSVKLFSKPEDLSSRLNELNIAPDVIKKIIKEIEQPGGDGSEALGCLISMAVSSESCVVAADNHHHHHYYHDDYHYGHHHHC